MSSEDCEDEMYLYIKNNIMYILTDYELKEFSETKEYIEYKDNIKKLSIKDIENIENRKTLGELTLIEENCPYSFCYKKTQQDYFQNVLHIPGIPSNVSKYLEDSEKVNLIKIKGGINKFSNINFDDEYYIDDVPEEYYKYLKRLTIKSPFNQPIEELKLPKGLKEFNIEGDFNQPIEELKLPKGLKEFNIDGDFNQPIEELKLPKGLKELFFMGDFNQPIEELKLPKGLTKLIFMGDFNQLIEELKLPDGLKELGFSGDFNQPIDELKLPDGLKELFLGIMFRHPIKKLKLHPGLTIIRET